MKNEEGQGYIQCRFPCDGENEIIIYPIVEGIEIVYMDFNSDTVFSNTKLDQKRTEISWCSKGKIEFEFENNTYSYLREGDFWVLGSEALPISYSFPHNIFKGISLVITYELLTAKSYELLDLFSIDLDYIHDTLKLDESWYISKSDASLQHLFEELSKAKFNESIEYFKLKTIELLYITSRLKCQNKLENHYYSNSQILKVKKIREYLISHLHEKHSIKNIVAREELSLSTFQKIFAQVYGCPPYEYLKKYKMDEAARRLLNSNDKISDIALSLGYSNFSKFAVAFKDVYSILPKDYRKKK